MGRRRPRPISEALGQVQGSLTPPSTLAAIQADWTDLVGGPVAAVTRPASERAGTLSIHCSDAVWAEELSMMKEGLLERLRERLGPRAPTDLRFKVGDLST